MAFNMKVVSVVLCVFLAAFVIGAGAAAADTQSFVVKADDAAAQAKAAAEAVVKADGEAEKAMQQVANKLAEEAKAAAKAKDAADSKAANEANAAAEAKAAAEDKAKVDRQAEKVMQEAANKAAGRAQNADRSEEAASKAADDRQAEIAKLQKHMMEQVMGGLNAVMAHAEDRLLALNTKRHSIRALLSETIEALKGKEKAFDDASAAHRAADKECTTSKNAEVAATSALDTATASLKSRNPIVEKELAIISQLIDKVEELKSINEKQVNAGQETARNAAVAQSKDMAKSLQTLNEEAGPLSKMIEIAREHSEFTKPILDLLNQLRAKLLAEQNSLTSAVASAKNAIDKAQSSAASSCKLADATKVEE
jgi:hypothetical protein